MHSTDREILPHEVSYESLTHYQMNYFLAYNICIQHIPSSVRFSAPKLHTNTLAAILYTFVTQTTPTH